MKKIITLICLVGMMQNGFAKGYAYGSYYNYTQNITAGGIWSVNNYITANAGDSIVFDSYFSYQGFYQYPDQWYIDGAPIPGTNGQEFLSEIINQPCTYSAYINNSSQGWSNWIYFYINGTTGIQAINNINFLNVFPTAVTSSITIQLNSIKTNDIEISFFDMNGKELKTDFYKNVFGEFIKNENTEALAKGIYFLRIKTGEDVAERKFVKM